MSASVPSDKSFPFRLLTLFWKSFFYHVLVLVCQLIITYWDLQIFKRKAYFLAIKQLSVGCYQSFSFSHAEQSIIMEVDLKAE